MAEIFARLGDPRFDDRYGWVKLKSFGYTDDGFVAWYTFHEGWLANRTCVLKRNDMDAHQWAILLSRLIISPGFVTGSTMGEISTQTALRLVFFLVTKKEEGYYDIDSQTIVLYGKIHKSNLAVFRP